MADDFVRKTPDMDNELEALEGLNESRQKLMEQMEPLMQTFTDTRSSSWDCTDLLRKRGAG
ncbi:MAG: hypothetical protein ACLUOI_12280 [Eisenbergiella sp.]